LNLLEGKGIDADELKRLKDLIQPGEAS
jgi:hypothetical protein